MHYHSDELAYMYYTVDQILRAWALVWLVWCAMNWKDTLLKHGLCSHSRKESVGNFKNSKGERFGLLVNYPIKNS